jgi:integrase
VTAASSTPRNVATAQHVPRAEYARWLREDLRCSSDLTRQRLRHYDIFTTRWPDLGDWLATPLLERIDVEALNRHEIGCVTRPMNGGVPTSYLSFASLRHGVRLDTPLLLMLKVAFALRPDAMGALGLDRDAFDWHRDRLVELGYNRPNAYGTVSWGLPRLTMWRGDPDVTAITADDLEAFAGEVRAFHETDAALPVSRMRARATDRSPDRDAADWAANRRHYQISRVFMLHVLLFNAGQVERPPDRGVKPARSWRDEIVPPGTPAPMAELVTRWLHWRDSIDTSSSGDAARRSRDALRYLITYLREEFPEVDSFDLLTREHIEGFLQHLPHRRAALTGKPLSLSFRRIVIGALRAFVKQTNDMDWPGAPARNLVLPADQPRQPRALPRYVPEDELNRLMAAVAALEDPQQRAALTLLRWSGARRDEIRRLDTDCLDHYPDGHPRLRIPVGKGLEERAIPLHPDAAAALRELIDHARTAASAPRWDRRAGRSVRYVFSSHSQLRSPTFLFNDSLRLACEQAGLVHPDGRAKITAHRFRHTVGTQLAEGGARLQTIMAILGHRSPQMAMIYTNPRKLHQMHDLNWSFRELAA